MANATVRDDLMSPSFARTFTAFAADQILHLDAKNGGVAPDGINHLPCTLFVDAAAADVLELYDASDTANTITFSAAFIGTIRFAAKTLGDATTVNSVTVFWNPEP